MDDVFSWVCSRPIKPCYIFDLPRVGAGMSIDIGVVVRRAVSGRSVRVNEFAEAEFEKGSGTQIGGSRQVSLAYGSLRNGSMMTFMPCEEPKCVVFCGAGRLSGVD